MLNFDLVSENNYIKFYKYAVEKQIPTDYIFIETNNIVTNDPFELQKISFTNLKDEVSKEKDVNKLIEKYLFEKKDYTKDIISYYYEIFPENKDSLKYLIGEEETIENIYKEWKINYNIKLENDKNILESYTLYLENLNKNPTSYFSKPFISSGNIRLKLKNINHITTFNKLKCTKNLRMIKYTSASNVQNFYKIYDEETDTINYNDLINKEIEDNHMLLIYYINEQFIYVDIDYNTNIADTSTNVSKGIVYTNIKLLIDEIMKQFEVLRVDYYNLNGYFGIYGIVLFNDIISSYILKEDTVLLAINETEKPLFLQNQVYILYNSFSNSSYGKHTYDLRIHYEVEKLQPDLKYNVMNLETKPNIGLDGFSSENSLEDKKLTDKYYDYNQLRTKLYNINPNFVDYATVINFSNGTLQELYYFIFLFNKILYDYWNKVEDYKQIFRRYIKDYDQSFYNNIKYVKVPVLGMKQIQILKDQSEEVTCSGYARICQPKDKHPDVVEESEYMQNINNPSYIKISSANKEKNYFYKCNSKQYIYAIGLENNTLENKEEFPIIPCCSERETGKSQNTFSYYTEIVYLPDPKLKIKNPILQGRINNQGVISYPTLENNKLLHEKFILNMNNSNNSFVYAIFLVNELRTKNYSEYSNILSYDFTEHYNYNNFLSLIQNMDLSFMYQELYDLKDNNAIKDDILKADINSENYYSRYVSLFEELFDFNIYVIEDGKFIKPRYKFVHYKRLRKQGLILMRREKKQYNIVFNVDVIENNSRSKDIYFKSILLDEEENIKFNNLYSNFELLQEGKIIPKYNINELDIIQKLNNEKLNTQNTIPSLENLGSIYPNYQLIDGYGKCRGFIFKLKDKAVTYIIPPQQPYNIPSIRDITYIDFNLIQQYTKYIESIDYYNNYLYGIWLNYENLNIYIPVIPTQIQLNYKIGNHNPYKINEKESSYFRYLKLENTLIKILQILHWLIILAHKENYNSDVIIKLLTFSDGIRKSDTNTSGTENIYKLDNINAFPKVNNLYEALQWLSINCNTLVEKDTDNFTIKMYNRKFFYGIRYFIKEFIKHNDFSKSTKNEFERNFHTSKDFNSIENNTLLMNDRAYDNWKLYYNKIKTKKYEFKTTLIGIDEKLEDPYYFYYNNEYYIIQNVKDGNLNRSIQVCYNWKYQNKNTGYNTEFGNKNLFASEKYEVYNKSFIKEGETTSEPIEKFQILKLKDNVYAAILKIKK